MDEQANRLKALGDPLRLRLVALLHARGETCVCELLDALGTTQGNISAHLRVLRAAGLIHGKKVGKWVFYRLADETVADLLAWLRTHLEPATAGSHSPPGALFPLCCAGLLPLSRRAAQARLAEAPEGEGAP